MGYYGLAFRLMNTFLNLFRPIPPLAWVPLVMAWFGVASFATVLGIETGRMYVYLNNLKFSMIFIIFIGGFYPILTSSIHGVRNVNRTLIDSARVLGANEYQVFRKVLLPAAMPSIMNGLRIGLGISWMCLVSAEMLPGQHIRGGLFDHSRLHPGFNRHCHRGHGQHRYCGYGHGQTLSLYRKQKIFVATAGQVRLWLIFPPCSSNI